MKTKLLKKIRKRFSFVKARKIRDTQLYLVYRKRGNELWCNPHGITLSEAIQNCTYDILGYIGAGKFYEPSKDY